MAKKCRLCGAVLTADPWIGGFAVFHICERGRNGYLGMAHRLEIAGPYRKTKEKALSAIPDRFCEEDEHERY